MRYSILWTTIVALILGLLVFYFVAREVGNSELFSKQFGSNSAQRSALEHELWTTLWRQQQLSGNSRAQVGESESDSEGVQSRIKAMPREAILKLADKDAYYRFLKEAAKHGLKVLDKLDRFQTVRVEITDFERFGDWLRTGQVEAAPNYLVTVPPAPEAPIQELSLDGYQGLGTGLWEWLGVDGISLETGKGMTVAVLDSGIASHPAFQEGSIRRGENAIKDIESGHGTSVASLIAGSHELAQGVAPGASLLDIPVLDANGVGDSFTLAAGIVEAVDSGAQI
ncbi:MAG: S8 family serine peptidase, partial [Verrucomicrobiota bacterium]